MSVLMPVPLHLDDCSFVGGGGGAEFEVRKDESFSIVLSQDYFGCSASIEIPNEFFYKRMSLKWKVNEVLAIDP